MTDTAHDQSYSSSTPTESEGADPKRQVRVQFNEANLNTLYANAFRSSLGSNELFLDLGINHFTGDQPVEGDESKKVGTFRFDVSHRVVLNPQTAKQLAQHLTQVVADLEKRTAAGAQPQGS
ncbi:MAG: DUF3467 domain-containing protein [Algisphaera sp.]